MATQGFRPNKQSLFQVSVSAETRLVSLQESKRELELRRDKVRQSQQQMERKVQDEFSQLMRRLLDAENGAVTRVRELYRPYVEELEGHIGELERELSELESLTKHLASLDPSQSILGTYRGKASNLDEELERLGGKLWRPSFLSEERVRAALKKFSSLPQVKLVFDPALPFQLSHPCKLVVDKPRSPVRAVDPSSWGVKIAPHDMKSAGGHLFLLKRYDNTVFVVEEELGLWTCFQVDRSLWYNSVHGLAVSRGRVLVSVPDKDCVKMLTVEGEFLNDLVRVLGHGCWHEMKRPHGMATTRSNLVVIANTGAHQVLVYNLESDFSKQLSSNPFTSSKLISPTEVAVTPQDDIVVLHQGTPFLHLYSISGELLAKFGTCVPNESGKLFPPRHLSIGPSGLIVVVDREHLSLYRRSSPLLYRVAYAGGWGKAVLAQKDRLLAYANGVFAYFSLEGMEGNQLSEI